MDRLKCRLVIGKYLHQEIVAPSLDVRSEASSVFDNNAEENVKHRLKLYVQFAGLLTGRCALQQ